MRKAPELGWWNSHWRDIAWWNAPLTNFGSDTPDLKNKTWVSKWHAMPPNLFPEISYTRDSQSLTRDQNNQNQTVNFSLRSQQVIEYRDCYYRAWFTLRLDTYNGRFVGDFDHYEGACYKHSVTNLWGGPQRQIVVQFNMNGKSLLPWETERLTADFDGRDVVVDIQNRAYQYSRYSNDGINLVYEAGAKIQTAPPGGISLDLVSEGGVLKLRVTDNHAQHYNEEALDFSYTVYHYTTKWFGTRGVYTPLTQKTTDAPERRVINGSTPNQQDIILGSAASGRYYLYNSSVRRVSRLSRPDWMTLTGRYGPEVIHNP